MEQMTLSLKPFVEWGTGLINRYKHDSNTRTTVHIVLLQIGLTFLSIAVFGWALEYTQTHTVAFITKRVSEAVMGTTTQTVNLPEALAGVRDTSYFYVFTGLIILNALFGYLMAQFALRPTRQNFSFQKRFIGNVAHEIRTPLAIIKTATEVSLLDSKLTADARETLETTIGELDRISETINNLLSFDSLMRPKTMQFESVDLTPIIEAVIGRHQDLAASRGVTIEASLLPSCVIAGNATALEQVVTNLLKNAINYTPAHKDGIVSVFLVRTPQGTVSLTIRDTGVGIAEKDIYHIFEPFYRADMSRARGVGTGAAGLGLAIVNEIVRLHHGSITVRSTVGAGTSIRVTLPIARRALHQPSVVRSVPEGIELGSV